MANPEFRSNTKIIRSGFLEDGRHFTETDIGVFVEPFSNNNNRNQDQNEFNKLISEDSPERIGKNPKSGKVKL